MIKRLFSLIVVAMLIFGFTGMAVGGGQAIRVYTYGIYDTGAGTTVAGRETETLSASSQYFTWTANGNKAVTLDNRTLDLNDTAPNWRAMTFRVDISAVTGVSTSGNTWYVTAESCTELDDVNCNWGQGVASGTSTVNLTNEVMALTVSASGTWTGTSKYPKDITTLVAPAVRYYRFRFNSGGSQYPGSPTGTSWASEVGPKAYLVITSY